MKIDKLSEKVVAIPDKEESEPDHENPSNLIKKNRRWNNEGAGTYVPVTSGSTRAIMHISWKDTAHLCILASVSWTR